MGKDLDHEGHEEPRRAQRAMIIIKACPSMLLYTTQITSRIRYITAFIGEELFQDSIELTNSKEFFLSYAGPRINYSNQAVGSSEMRINPAGLLHQEGITAIPIQCFKLNNYQAFFKTNECDFPFDVLSAAFYLISRYEEYLPYVPDRYGRYPHTDSLAWKEGFLHLPLVDIWLNDLRQSLVLKFPDLQFAPRSFRLLPTYDIDIAWSYLNKGLFRNTVGMIKSILTAEWERCRERIRVLRRKQTDPYDAYAWLNQLHLHCKIKAGYFFLLARRAKGYDRNVSPLNRELQQLIQNVSGNHSIGMHPSWQSGDHEELLSEEVSTFEKLSDTKILQSRQHYLRFTLPETYRRLIGVGVTKEFSMGYGAINGFRASVASSFYWYDLEKEETSNLVIFPFCFMDATAFYELKLSPQQAYEQLVSFFQTIEKVNGLMITIWHNQFLGSDVGFTGWKEAYEKFIREVSC